ncbi:glycosyltransferase family 2 protein [Paenibacillus radicis (ex Xue et al. 2023)]|uniref:Glycosyltransferase family 2 protein n=1 Tax=Paenibacillus radicis (ex Xue et al. 2023) TaxID=2972489 RepID=A0ABT1YIL1_9BACL|nr:glycosyltransferase family 2 protein [Paenibacillus radicis (ex Xue et al. 2023)]MCR8633024.1 glycosyltransferase family 2 protein [Paenibacillus radicis (ex Xue et al. 2023)]
MANDIKYSVIVPMFNEQEVIAETYRRLKIVLGTLNEEYELLFVNDGSRDRTTEIVRALCLVDPNVRMLSFARNFGHQVAISAGMDHAQGQAIIVIDADLQDPPEVILEMISKWKEGYEVIYGKRLTRRGESIFKKWTAHVFYRFLKTMTSFEIPVDTGDFRLIDRKVCDVMKTLTEKNRYVRGLISWVGFRQTAVEYDREERWAGETKYPLRKMIQFAMDAIGSFSYKPLRLATYLGFSLSGISFLYFLIVVYQKLLTNSTITGWSSIVAINLFFNGIMLVILGIIGEYIGRIYDESKGRPLYIIQEKTGYQKQQSAPAEEERYEILV